MCNAFPSLAACRYILQPDGALRSGEGDVRSPQLTRDRASDEIEQAHSTTPRFSGGLTPGGTSPCPSSRVAAQQPNPRDVYYRSSFQRKTARSPDIVGRR